MFPKLEYLEAELDVDNEDEDDAEEPSVPQPLLYLSATTKLVIGFPPIPHVPTPTLPSMVSGDLKMLCFLESVDAPFKCFETA
jgi:hypothetical protein